MRWANELGGELTPDPEYRHQRHRFWKRHQYIDDMGEEQKEGEESSQKGIKADDYQWKPPPPPPPPPAPKPKPIKKKGKLVYPPAPPPPPPPPPPPGDFTDKYDKYASKPVAEIKKAKKGTYADHFNSKMVREKDNGRSFFPEEEKADKKNQEPQSKEAFWKKHLNPNYLRQKYRNIEQSHEKRARAATDPFIPMVTRQNRNPRVERDHDIHVMRELVKD